jgi:hypothetical protein
MPADNLSPHEMLNYVPLTAAVNQVVTDLPKILPPAFYTQERPVLGNKFRRFLVRGTRQTSRRANYGAPPRTVNRIVRSRQDVVMLHTIENINAGDEVLQIFHGMQDYNVSMMAQEVLDQDALEFGRRIDNHRTAAIHSMAANGFIWYDANDEILPTSVGAVTTVDYQIPAGNRVAAAADWSNPATDVVSLINNFKSLAQRNGGGRMPKHAIYGQNVAGYLARNTSFQAYLARNTAFNDYFKGTGQIMPGVLGLEWCQAQDAYFERSDESFPMQFPADQITFFPELTRDVYELKVGSYPVPKQFYGFTNGGDFGSMVREMFDNPVYGPFKYSYGQALPTPQIWMVQGDTFFPDLPNPGSIWYYDTTP